MSEAGQVAVRGSTRTTKLYDRPNDDITLDEIAHILL